MSKENMRNKQNPQKTISRREFLKAAGLTGCGLGAMAAGLFPLASIVKNYAAATSGYIVPNLQVNLRQGSYIGKLESGVYIWRISIDGREAGSGKIVIRK